MLLRQIEYFQAVIEHGNFHEAAEQCHVSQSAISQQIKKLEEELDVKLLERHNRTFSLTPAGEHFYRKSLVITGDIGQMLRETKRIAANDNKIISNH
jgi:DNA-binding transcriptional LysR family regulator